MNPIGEKTVSYRQSMSATKRLAVGRLGTVAIDASTTFILLRICGPSNAGIMALATTIATAFTALGDWGASASLVSEKNDSPARHGAAFAISALAFASIAAATLLGQQLLPLLTTPSTSNNIAWFAAMGAVAFTTLSQLPIAVAQQRTRFTLLAFAPLVSAAAGTIASISAAAFRSDITPLIVKALVSSGTLAVILWIFTRPKFSRPSRADFHAVFSWGRGQTVFNILNYFNRNADSLVVSRFLGEAALGHYSTAYRVLMQPLALVGSVVNTTEYPRLSALAPDWHALATSLSNSMRMVARLITPLCLGVAFTASEIVEVVLGKAWTPAVEPLRILALLGIYQAPASMNGLAYQASRQMDRMAFWGLLATPPLVLSFLAGVRWGIVGVAASYALTTLALSIPLTRITAATLNTRPMVLAAGPIRGWLESIPGGIGIGAAYLLSSTLGFGSLGRLISTCAAGITVWSLMWRGTRRLLLGTGEAAVRQEGAEPSPQSSQRRHDLGGMP